MNNYSSIDTIKVDRRYKTNKEMELILTTHAIERMEERLTSGMVAIDAEMRTEGYYVVTRNSNVKQYWKNRLRREHGDTFYVVLPNNSTMLCVKKDNNELIVMTAIEVEVTVN